MPTVTYTNTTVVGNNNNQIYSSGVVFDMAQSGSFPSDSDWRVTAVKLTISVLTQYSGRSVSVRKTSSGGTEFGETGFTSGTHTLPKSTWGSLSLSTFKGVTKLCLRGVGGDAGTLNLGSAINLAVTYESTYTACTAPTSFTVSPSITGASATLTWSGAAGGTGNAITGYGIQCADSSNGTTWGDWQDLATVESTETSGTLTANTNPAYGGWRKYRIRTQGAAGSTYYSGYTESTGTVQTFGRATAPTSVTVSNPTPPISTQVTLSWSGAAAGTGDVITGYRILRGVSLDALEAFATVSTSETSGTYTVTSPDEQGETYYFKVQTLAGAGEHFDSELSASHASVASGYGACTAPTFVTIKPRATTPQGAVCVSWSGATGGEDNPIAGYQVMRSTSINGNYYLIGETTSEEFYTFAHEGIGAYYYYRVITVGTQPGYNSAMSTDYTRVKTVQPVMGRLGSTNAVV